MVRTSPKAPLRLGSHKPRSGRRWLAIVITAIAPVSCSSSNDAPDEATPTTEILSTSSTPATPVYEVDVCSALPPEQLTDLVPAIRIAKGRDRSPSDTAPPPLGVCVYDTDPPSPETSRLFIKVSNRGVNVLLNSTYRPMNAIDGPPVGLRSIYIEYSSDLRSVAVRGESIDVDVNGPLTVETLAAVAGRALDRLDRGP